MRQTLIRVLQQSRNNFICRVNRHQICLPQRDLQRNFLTSAVGRTNRPVISSYKLHRDWQQLLRRNKPPILVLSCDRKRWFHVTPRRQALPLPPLIWAFFAKIGAIFTGRSLRKWLKTQPKEVRRKYQKLLLIKLAALLGGFGVFSTIYYYSHQQDAPITRRKRFISLKPDQYLKVANYESDRLLEQVKESVLPATHPYYDIVIKIARRLVAANRDIPEMASQNWTVYVVKSDQVNALVLPNGYVFVFTGLIEFMDNEDQLAMVIGHEMAHAVMLHAAEQLSYTKLLDYLVILVMAAIWCIMPSDGIALVTQWFYKQVMDLTIHMPYSRKLEREADVVGLHLASKACYDVREGSVFWGKMDITSDIKNDKLPEWLSTHPSHGNRVELFDFLLPKALEERKKNHCPPLAAWDPRDRIKLIKKKVDNNITAHKARVNLQKVHMVKPPSPFYYTGFNRSLVADEEEYKSSWDVLKAGIDADEENKFEGKSGGKDRPEPEKEKEKIQDENSVKQDEEKVHSIDTAGCDNTEGKSIAKEDKVGVKTDDKDNVDCDKVGGKTEDGGKTR